MVRHGMVTIGVAVQAETFTDTPSSSNPGPGPSTASASTSPTNTHNVNATTSTAPRNDVNPTNANVNPTSPSSKSAIFLTAPKAGVAQTLKITFSYNKDTNLPEVLVTVDETSDKQSSQVKDLRQLEAVKDTGRGERGDTGEETNKESAFAFADEDKDKALSLYSFGNMGKFDPSQGFEVKSPKQNVAKSRQLVPHVEIVETALNTDDHNEGLPYVTTPTSPAPSRIEGKDDGKIGKEGEISRDGQTEQNADNNPTLGVPRKVKVDRKNNHVEFATADKGSSPYVSSSSKSEGTDENSSGSGSYSQSSGGSGSGSTGSTKSHSRPARRKSKSRNISSSDNEAPQPPESPTKKAISDRSKIPFLNSAATGYLPCEYYRQKWLQEIGCPESEAGWTNFNSVQKIAGQKVVNKLNAQQKKLEEEAAAQKKRTEFIFHEELGFTEVPQEKLQLRKKQTRLEPLQICT